MKIKPKTIILELLRFVIYGAIAVLIFAFCGPSLIRTAYKVITPSEIKDAKVNEYNSNVRGSKESLHLWMWLTAHGLQPDEQFTLNNKFQEWKQLINYWETVYWMRLREDDARFQK